MACASATPGASGYNTVYKAVVTEIEPAAPEASTQKGDDNVYILLPREKMAPVDNRTTKTVQHQVFQSPGPQNTGPDLHSVPVQLPAPASQQWCGDSSTISCVLVPVLQFSRCGATGVDTVKTEPHLEALMQHIAGRLAVLGASAAADVTLKEYFCSEIASMSKELVKALRKQSGMTQAASTIAFVGH